MAKVFIADDSETLLRVFSHTLGENEIVGSSTTSDNLLKKFKESGADILILDLKFDNKDRGKKTNSMMGVAFLESTDLEKEEVKVIAISQFNNISLIKHLYDNGIKAYIDKKILYRHIQEAINAIMDGEIYYQHELLSEAIYGKNVLTKREYDIIRMCCDGESDAKIGETLDFHINTVRGDIRSAMKKIGVKTRAELIAWAGAEGIIR